MYALLRPLSAQRRLGEGRSGNGTAEQAVHQQAQEKSKYNATVRQGGSVSDGYKIVNLSHNPAPVLL